MLHAPPLPPIKPADRASFPAFQAWMKQIGRISIPEADLRQSWNIAADGSLTEQRSPASVSQAIRLGAMKFVDICAPVLAIFAIPLELGPWLQKRMNSAEPSSADAFMTSLNKMMDKQAKAFEDGVPSAHVVRLRNANHYIFLSNETDVLKAIRTFLVALE
jgi:non-heme chloroperoxidase